MRKAFLFVSILLFTAVAVFAQSQTAALPRLAVVQFTTNANTEKIRMDAITVRELVESEMVKTRKYQIITRSDIDLLLENQRIQVSSISSAENLKKLELQNIRYIITGSLSAMGSDYAVTVRVLDVSTGQFSHSDNDFMGSGSREMYTGITNLMTKFNAGMSAGEGGAIVQGQGTGRTYNIGDTGPAGGIIFYDRGFISDGWRYLEAAPAGTEFIAEWGARGQDVAGTGTAVGSGKRNTELIVNRLRQLGENDCAAQICIGMEINGYKDWFLPSKDELNLMYKNLKAKGLGGFGNGWYWSSSQYSTGIAWFNDFYEGGRYYNYESNAYFVRAVRAF